MKKNIALAISALITFQTASADLISSESKIDNWHSLIVGIDKYNAQNMDGGPVNDANLLTDSLKEFFVQIRLSGSGSKDILEVHDFSQLDTLIDKQAKDYAIKEWWDQRLEEIDRNDVIFFAYSGISEPDSGLMLTMDKNNMLSNLQLLNWASKAIDGDATVILALDTCSNLDIQLSGLQELFKNKLIIFKPAQTKDTVSIDIDGEKYGIVSYLLSQIFLEKALNESGKPISTLQEIKDYLISGAKEYDREISVFGVSEANADRVILPVKNEADPASQ